MALLDEATFNTKWADVAGNFADNTTRDITEAIIREFAEDVKDSLVFRGSADSLTYKIVNIGDWNMDSTVNVSVAHGLANFKNIRSVSVILRDDSDAIYYAFPAYSGLGGAIIQAGIGQIDSTNIVLSRQNASDFDSTSFNSTGFNRGFITIGYVA
jgi:hypothetical protein